MHETQVTAPPAELVARLRELTDFTTPWALLSAMELDVFSLIAAGNDRAEDLAAACGCRAEPLGKLLRYLVTCDVVRELQPGRYALTPLGDLLCAGHPAGVWRFLAGDSGGPRRLALAWAGLTEAIRTGRPGYTAVFGRTLWDDTTEDFALATWFNGRMASSAALWVAALARAWRWHTAHRLIDVGGGTGTATIALLKEFLELRGTVVDLPPAVAAARAAIADAGLAARADTAAGSFFDPLPTGGDVYLLAQILHDWPDEDALRILGRCSAAAGPSGRILLVERINGQPEEDHRRRAELDLMMFNLFAGNERDKNEWFTLTTRAGLRIESIVPLERGLSLIECIPQ